MLGAKYIEELNAQAARAAKFLLSALPAQRLQNSRHGQEITERA